MQDYTVYRQIAIVMENIGAGTGYCMADRLGEGPVVALVRWLSGAQDSDSVLSLTLVCLPQTGVNKSLVETGDEGRCKRFMS